MACLEQVGSTELANGKELTGTDGKINNAAVIADTIVAAATPMGKGGVGIVRISGPDSYNIAKKICGFSPQKRYAHFASFSDSSGEELDQGIVIFFKAPHSFTGEDVIELQGHGGPVIINQLISCCEDYGARQARPGEFSERAFLNKKIDLIQAEAIADLIDAGSKYAAQAALRSMTGDFSNNVTDLKEKLIDTRKWIEASIDFSDEEIDFMQVQELFNQIQIIHNSLKKLLARAESGVALQNGIQVVLSGAPNSGKSTLINKLSGDDVAIVTPQAGTTRDKIETNIFLQGLPLQIIDTAGLRDSRDLVEQEGIKRAQQAIVSSDVIIWMCGVDEDDSSLCKNSLLSSSCLSETLNKDWGRCLKWLEELKIKDKKLLYIVNKGDLLDSASKVSLANSLQHMVTKSPFGKDISITTMVISAHTGYGVNELQDKLCNFASYSLESSQGAFSARKRHLRSLTAVMENLQQAIIYSKFDSVPFELVAEELRLAQLQLSELTGEYTSDDLLGEIFSNFCIGK